MEHPENSIAGLTSKHKLSSKLKKQWPSRRTTLPTTSPTRLTRMVSRSPGSTVTPPPKGWDPKFLRNQRYATKHNKKGVKLVPWPWLWTPLSSDLNSSPPDQPVSVAICILDSKQRGFTKFSLTDYVRWKQENRIDFDGCGIAKYMQR